jgi:hypothetical protein
MSRVSRRAAVAVLAAGCSSSSTVPGDAGAGDGAFDPIDVPVWSEVAGDFHSIVAGPLRVLYDPPDGVLGAFPSAMSFDGVVDGRSSKQVIVHVGQSEDVASASPQGTSFRSFDGGANFPEAYSDPVSPLNGLRLEDGRIVTVGFKPIALDGLRAELPLARSSDGGATWSDEVAVLEATTPITSLRMHRGGFQQLDGTILMPHYIRYQGQTGHGIELAESRDGGETWTRRGTIAAPTEQRSYNEVTVAEVADGSMLAITRTALASGAFGPLLQFRSDDDGRTWSEPSEVQIQFGDAAPGPRPAVDPHLFRLPSGVLVLAAGRPDNWVAISRDGSGESWEGGRVIYVNYPTTPAGASRHHGSSGYLSMAGLASHRLLITGDNCANSWGCPASEGGWTVDGQYRVWLRSIDIAPADPGRIDLAGKLASGRIALAGDMTWTSSAHPEAGAAAAFDGSIEPWSSAIKASGSEDGDLTIELDRTYQLTRIGVALRRGHAGAARVYLSEDGDEWYGPVVDAAGPHRALRSFAPASPVAARFVKVRVTGEPDCGAGLEGGCSALAELEIYATVDSFENEAIGVAPRGTTNAAMATVVSDEGGQALRVHDTSATGHARIQRLTTPSPRKRLELRLRPDALPNAFLFDLLGRDGDEVISTYHLAVLADGRFARYDPASESWSPVGEAGLVGVDRWSTIRLDAGLDSALLTVDGVEIATLPPSSPGADSLVGWSFASAGTAPVGDDVVIDDVLFE